MSDLSEFNAAVRSALERMGVDTTAPIEWRDPEPMTHAEREARGAEIRAALGLDEGAAS